MVAIDVFAFQESVLTDDIDADVFSSERELAKNSAPC